MAIAYIKSDNIISSLGFTTDENINAVFSGVTGLKYCKENTLDVPEAFISSQINDELLNEYFLRLNINNQYFSKFEKLIILSIYEASSKIEISLASQRTLFIISTTKGNISLLEDRNEDFFCEEQLFIGHSAEVIARFFHNPNKPIVVSNACISGVSAQIVAKRLLNTGKYDNAVVVGADVLSKFIVSGFQSFKALSADYCKPFDSNRVGLNLGEGAATIIYGVAQTESALPKDTIVLEAGAITNDANHISGPSRTGEGLYLALKSITNTISPHQIGFINAHGTATPYNDEMESIAISRVELTDVPTNSLKGYFGHTLGAAGLLETVVSSQSLKNNKLVKSLGYDTCGVSVPLNIIKNAENKKLLRCIKMVSGFGGCNAAIMLKKID